MDVDRRFSPEFAVFSTVDLALLEAAETCPLCQTNPPILKYHTGSGGIRHEGHICLTCACQVLAEITAREIGQWMARSGHPRPY